MNDKFKETVKEESSKNINEEKIVNRRFANNSLEKEKVRQVIEYAMQNLKNKVMGSGEIINGKSR